MADTISFVIYYHPSRLHNLSQTIRFLEKRDPNCLGGELVLVCQGKSPPPTCNFKTYQHHNMEMASYNKPVMCNHGVRCARHELVALLDSDRVLSRRYFERNAASIKPGQFVTTLSVLKLEGDYTDEEIDSDRYTSRNELRCVYNDGFAKNMFSGNTLMFKKDYRGSGGMDESFAGYGFADSDMTRNVTAKGYNTIYLRDTELHLDHPAEIEWCGSILGNESYQIISATNSIRYCVKWNTTPDTLIAGKLASIDSKLGSFPQELVKEYSSWKARLDTVRRASLM